VGYNHHHGPNTQAGLTSATAHRSTGRNKHFATAALRVVAPRRLARALPVLLGAALVASIVGVAPASAAITAFNWVKQSPTTSPPITVGGAMAYDSATGIEVVFGGYNTTTNAAMDDTWTYNGTTWTEQSPTTSPPAVFQAAMAYDPATGDVILFGGDNSSGTITTETWAWNGSTWTEETPSVQTQPLPQVKYHHQIHTVSPGHQ